jgi:hypothetical protein
MGDKMRLIPFGQLMQWIVVEYEAFMGRWSRPVARAFVEWLQPRRWAHWLDIGCGTGAFLASLDSDRREHLCNRLKQRLPTTADGSIRLRARAWAVCGFAP